MSIKIKSWSSTVKGILIASIVVPAISETINLSSFINLFINVDFPALGLPRTAIFFPSGDSYFSYVRAMHSVEECDVVIFICDAQEGIVDQDLKIINMICEMGKPVLIAFNKIDLLTKKLKDDIYETKRAQSNFVNDFIKLEISGIKGDRKSVV